ncbi:MAG: ABC transporter ATP-binding protein [Gammaproteobacteria bacterium]
MAEIVLDHVSKRYADGTPAVRSANFTIHDGEFFILVGPSGCGKSTLLNMIVGLEVISDGTIYVDGRRVNDLDPKDRNMAMVFQSYALYPHMTVRENMAFPLKLAKLPKAEIDQRVEEAAAMLELVDLLGRKPATLSGGQRQRVAMGRAIVRRPEVFLLDEPLSNLDARLRVQMRGEIARLQKRLGITTVYVTHDQTEAMILGDRVAVMKYGEVQQVGTPRQLYDAPFNRFTAGFIGSPPMNFFPARFNDGRLQFPMVEFALPEWKVHSYERPLIAGLRPEHIRLGPSAGNDVDFRAEVELCEWLGAELYVHFSVPLPPWSQAAAANNRDAFNLNRGIRLTARLDPAAAVTEGGLIDLCFDPGFLHLFDADTDEVIILPTGKT